MLWATSFQHDVSTATIKVCFQELTVTGVPLATLCRSEVIDALSLTNAAPHIRMDNKSDIPGFGVLKTRSKTDKKIVKSEKNNTSHSPAAHRCEQRNLHKQQNKCKSQSIKSSSPKKTERLHTDSELSNRSVQKTEKKPLASAENVQHIKMKKEGYTWDEIDKEINYAGAKFSDPPSPSVLPKPPSHWMGITGQLSDQSKEQMTHHLKTLLKVQL
ncbi:hypothetical protein GDO78_019783 [Eleutherodactylus coqui]|uniref:Proline-rich nuclear receptor coactivator 1 n=1 Tax=Eleutherodactylus coqui TaxID=57060 RepID=A0A8J6EIH2_ELECQ|nr:hypothetical protein GDO78_019783 [Eleutherodactylus coqui]